MFLETDINLDLVLSLMTKEIVQKNLVLVDTPS